ncbi:MAG: hypothetical protein ACR2OW_12915 [Methyloligellaceae bacterium]
MAPANPHVHPEKGFIELLQRTIARIANTIVQYEPVILLSSARDHRHIRMLMLWEKSAAASITPHNKSPRSDQSAGNCVA